MENKLPPKRLMHLHDAPDMLTCSIQQGGRYSMEVKSLEGLDRLKDLLLCAVDAVADYKVKSKIPNLPRFLIITNSQLLTDCFADPSAVERMVFNEQEGKLAEICFALIYKLRLIGGVVHKEITAVKQCNVSLNSNQDLREHFKLNWLNDKPLFISPHAFYRFAKRIAAIRLEGWRNPMNFIHKWLKSSKFQVNKREGDKIWYYEESTNSIFVVVETPDTQEMITYMPAKKGQAGLSKHFSSDYEAVPVGKPTVIKIALNKPK